MLNNYFAFVMQQRPAKKSYYKLCKRTLPQGGVKVFNRYRKRAVRCIFGTLAANRFKLHQIQARSVSPGVRLFKHFEQPNKIVSLKSG